MQSALARWRFFARALAATLGGNPQTFGDWTSILQLRAGSEAAPGFFEQVFILGATGRQSPSWAPPGSQKPVATASLYALDAT